MRERLYEARASETGREGDLGCEVRGKGGASDFVFGWEVLHFWCSGKVVFGRRVENCCSVAGGGL